MKREVITPKRAMEYLKRNVANRPLSMIAAKRLGDAMGQRKWMLNGESIKFNSNGDLIDGQHRLTGCVEAGVPFETYVMRGLPHEAFDTLDQGRKRSGGDVLARRGEQYYNVLACAISLAHQIHTSKTLDGGAALRPDEMIAFLNANPTIRETSQYVANNKGDGLVSNSVAAAMLFLFRTVDAKRADVFWSRVLDGEALTKDMPEYRLRQRLIDNKASSAKLKRGDLVALIIKAWNLSVAGRTVKALAFFEREEFPKIAGYKYAS